MAWSKESRQSRGYGTAWTKIRERVVKRDKGLCQACLRAGRVTIGKDVDHIVSKAEAKRRGWSDERTNADEQLEFLCVPCHKEKTALENGRAYKPKQKFGVDGWPIEE